MSSVYGTPSAGGWTNASASETGMCTMANGSGTYTLASVIGGLDLVYALYNFVPAGVISVNVVGTTATISSTASDNGSFDVVRVTRA